MSHIPDGLDVAIIVTHPSSDMDALISALALEAGLIAGGFEGEIKFHFLDSDDAEKSYNNGLSNATYEGMRLSGELYDVFGGQAIYHVDCGGSPFDHDHLERGNVSAAELVADKLGLLILLPEWKRIIEWAHQADNNTFTGNFNFRTIVRGFACSHTDGETLEYARTLVNGQLEIERMGVDASELEITQVHQLEWQPKSIWSIVVKNYPGFGRVGVIRMPTPFHRGPFVHRLGNHRLSISVDTKPEYGFVTITTNRKRPQDDLRYWGILDALRQAEANARGLNPLLDSVAEGLDPISDMGWIAFAPNGIIRAIMDGSPKAALPEDLKTKLSFNEILRIIDELIRSHTNH